MVSRWLAVSLVAVALAAPSPARAKTPEAIARKAAKTATASALKLFQAEAILARNEFKAAMTAFEATLGAAPDPLATTSALAEPIAALQRGLVEAMTPALEAATSAHRDAFTEFGNANFPRDLLAGGGGAADELRDGLRAISARTIFQARKRLEGTIGELREVGLRATIRLEPPRLEAESIPNVNTLTPFLQPPLTIDLLIGLSPDSDNLGGALFAGGQADPEKGDVAVAIDGSDGASGTATVDVGTRRWGVLFGELDPVDEGNEAVIATQGTDAPSVMAVIGVP
jgi:hypothetical protein